MRKICVPIIAGLVAFSAFGAGENVPTSKSYIDSVLVDKQDAIERTSGNNQALTNTGVAGNVGTKDIYDSTGEYAAQQDALVDAQTMNTAVQNAINAEFVCISWVDDDPSKDCLLMEIRGATERRSPNLFDISKLSTGTYAFGNTIVNNGDGSISIGASTYAIRSGKKLSQLAPELVPDKQYILTFNTTGRLTHIALGCNTSGTTVWQRGTVKTITSALLNCEVLFYLNDQNSPDAPGTISNIQITEGTTVQPYQPYGNIYLPMGN